MQVSMNRVELQDKFHTAIIEGDHVDEVETHDYKGQSYGYKVFEAKGDYFPAEYHGTWKCDMMWGDMCGDMNHGPLLRVSAEVVMVPVNEWVEV